MNVKGRMKAVSRCYVNEQLYVPGDEFDYEGPPSRAFYPVNQPIPVNAEAKASYDREMDAKIDKILPSDSNVAGQSRARGGK